MNAAQVARTNARILVDVSRGSVRRVTTLEGQLFDGWQSLGPGSASAC